MGRENKASWKANYFLKVVVSISIILSSFVIRILWLWKLYDEKIPHMNEAVKASELEIAEPTGVWSSLVSN